MTFVAFLEAVGLLVACCLALAGAGFAGVGGMARLERATVPVDRRRRSPTGGVGYSKTRL